MAHSSTSSCYRLVAAGVVAGLLFKEKRRELCEGAKMVCHICGEMAVVEQERCFLNMKCSSVAEVSRLCSGMEAFIALTR